MKIIYLLGIMLLFAFMIPSKKVDPHKEKTSAHHAKTMVTFGNYANNCRGRGGLCSTKPVGMLSSQKEQSNPEIFPGEIFVDSLFRISMEFEKNIELLATHFKNDHFEIKDTFWLSQNLLDTLNLGDRKLFIPPDLYPVHVHEDCIEIKF